MVRFFIFSKMHSNDHQIQKKRKPISIENEKIVKENGTKYYLIKWEGDHANDFFYSWVSELDFLDHPEIVSRYMATKSSLYLNKSSQTEHSLYIFNKIEPVSDEYDFFKNYVPKQIPDSINNSGYEIPDGILNFDANNKKFQIICVGKSEAKWIDAYTLAAISPELVARYFIDKELSEDVQNV